MEEIFCPSKMEEYRTSGGPKRRAPITLRDDDRKIGYSEGGVIRKRRSLKRLIKRCLELLRSPATSILDSFAGSGTTGAVAHKMGRRWIMVEIGDHADTHVVPRLKKVIDGEPTMVAFPRRSTLAGRRRLPLLHARPLAAGKGQVGQLGRREGI